jgi:hypothetical protein
MKIMKKPKAKNQKPNLKQTQMTKIQNRQIGRKISIKGSECFGNWIFGFGYYLEFGYWDLGF